MKLAAAHTKTTEPSAKDYISAIMAQWRLGDYDGFFLNVSDNSEALISFNTKGGHHEIGSLLLLAYKEAVIRDSADFAKRLRVSLLSVPGMMEQIRIMEDSSVADALERNASAMGRLALKAARQDLVSAESQRNDWRDAGMISLGFFRVLELEINQRLLLPTICAIDLGALNLEIGALENATDKHSNKAAAFWLHMMKTISKAHSQKQGLELGPIELLLAKTKTLDGADRAVKGIVRGELLKHLTPKGVEAFQSGQLSKLFNLEVRERFRNSGAHARFVDLDTARRAKAYVEPALQSIFEWTYSQSNGAQVIN